MRRINFLFGFLLTCSTMFGQTLIPTVNDKGLFGYSDLDGNLCIKCQYTTANPYEGDVALVERKGVWGLIDKSGNYVLPLQYTVLEATNHGIRRIQKGGKWGLADRDGKILINPTYAFISRFNCYGLAFVNTKKYKKSSMGSATGFFTGKFGVVDSTGTLLLQPLYANLGEFSEDANSELLGGGYGPNFRFLNESDTLITNGEYYWVDRIKALGAAVINAKAPLNPYVIDSQGKELVNDPNCCAVFMPQSGMVRYLTMNKQKGYDWNYANISTGETTTVYSGTKPAKKTHICNGVEACDFDGDLAFVGGEDRTNGYLVDKQGTKVLDNIKKMYPPKEGYFVACSQQNEIGLFKVDGTTIFPYGRYKDGSIRVGSGYWGIQADNNKWGFVDLNGEIVVKPVYDQVTYVQDGQFCYSMVNKWGCKKLNGQDIVPCQYEDLVFCEGMPDHMWVKENGLFYNYDVKTQKADKKTDGYKTLYVCLDGYRYAATAQCVEDNTAYLVNEAGVRMYNNPVPLTQFDMLRDYVIANGNKPLSTQQGRYFLLHASRGSRSYTLDAKVPDNEWDY